MLIIIASSKRWSNIILLNCPSMNTRRLVCVCRIHTTMAHTTMAHYTTIWHTLPWHTLPWHTTLPYGTHYHGTHYHGTLHYHMAHTTMAHTTMAHYTTIWHTLPWHAPVSCAPSFSKNWKGVVTALYQSCLNGMQSAAKRFAHNSLCMVAGLPCRAFSFSLAERSFPQQ